MAIQRSLGIPAPHVGGARGSVHQAMHRPWKGEVKDRWNISFCSMGCSNCFLMEF
jgi:hypothetical protein